jgi:hypothetical protein
MDVFQAAGQLDSTTPETEKRGYFLFTYIVTRGRNTYFKANQDPETNRKTSPFQVALSLLFQVCIMLRICMRDSFEI